MTRLIQRRIEKQVLEDFASVCPAGIDVGSIQMRDPPEPDARCTLRNGVEIAIEMVEIIDGDVPRDTERVVDIKFGLQRAWESRVSQGSTDPLEDAFVSILFSEGSSHAAQRKAIDPIVEALSYVKSDFEGAVDVRHHRLPAIVEFIRVRRVEFVGAVFDVLGGGSFRIPILETLSKKFTRTYHSSVPIELLAYYDTISAMPTEIWLTETITTFLRANLRASPFQRLWLFDRKPRRVLHVQEFRAASAD